MKVVIDTHCLLATIPRKSKYYWLYEAFENEKFHWVISTEILYEYEEMLIRKYSIKTANLVLSILATAPNTIFSEPFYKWHLITNDEDDDKFVDLALASNADYLITNDRDFNALKSLDFPKVKIINLDEFKEVFHAFQQ